MHKNVWTLTIAQAFMMSLNSLNVFAGGLIGKNIAPSEKLATLPVASIIVGTAVATKIGNGHADILQCRSLVYREVSFQKGDRCDFDGSRQIRVINRGGVIRNNRVTCLELSCQQWRDCG